MSAQVIPAHDFYVRLSISVLTRNSVVTRAIIYAGTNALQGGLSLLLLPVYARYLSPADYGIIGLTSSVTGVLTLLLGLGIYGAITRYYFEYRHDPSRLRAFISTNFLFVVAIGLVLALVLTWLGAFVWDAIGGGQIPFSPYLLLALWISYSAMLVQLPLVFYRAQQRAELYAGLQVGMFLARTSLILFFVVWRDLGAYGQLLGDLIGTAVFAVLMSLFLLREYFSTALRTSYLRVTLRYGLPLVPHVVAGWTLAAVDRVMLESRIPLADLGLYTLGYQLGMIMSLLVSSFHQAWAPHYFDLMERPLEAEGAVRRTLNLYVPAMSFVCVFGSMFGVEAVLWLLPARYGGSGRFIPPILLGYLFQGLYYFASLPLFYHKHTSLIPRITIAAAILNVSLNLWWIPIMGAMGSAWATTVSFLVTFVLAFISSRKYQSSILPDGRIVLSLLFATIAVIVSTLTANYVGQHPFALLPIKLGVITVFAFGFGRRFFRAITKTDAQRAVNS